MKIGHFCFNPLDALLFFMKTRIVENKYYLCSLFANLWLKPVYRSDELAALVVTI